MKTIRWWIGIVLWTMVGVLGIATVNHRLPEWDLTRGRYNTVSPESVAVLAQSTESITIRAYFQDNGDDAARIRRVLSQLKRHSSAMDFEIVDMDLYPQKAALDQVTDYGSIVVNVGDRRRIIYFSELMADGHLDAVGVVAERSIIDAIRFLTTQRSFEILVVTGHGERPIEGADRKSLFQWVRLLSDDGWRVRQVSLITSPKIPSNGVLVIAAPAYLYSQLEIETIHRFIKSGGRCIVLGDLGNHQILNPLTLPMGIKFQGSLVVDSKGSVPNTPAFLIPRIQSTPITITLLREKLPIILPVSVAINIDDAQAKVPLLISSIGQVLGAIASYGEGGVLVFGDVDWLSNEFIGTPGNRRLSLMMVRFLCGDASGDVDVHPEIASSVVLTTSGWWIMICCSLSVPILIFAWMGVRRR